MIQFIANHPRRWKMVKFFILAWIIYKLRWATFYTCHVTLHMLLRAILLPHVVTMENGDHCLVIFIHFILIIQFPAFINKLVAFHFFNLSIIAEVTYIVAHAIILRLQQHRCNLEPVYVILEWLKIFDYSCNRTISIPLNFRYMQTATKTCRLLSTICLQQINVFAL